MIWVDLVFLRSATSGFRSELRSVTVTPRENLPSGDTSVSNPNRDPAECVMPKLRAYAPHDRACPSHRPRDIVVDMTDILIRDVPDEVVAALDANAHRSGQTRAEYLRRLLADQQRPALTRDQLNRFAERTADLGDPEVMGAAWR